MAKTAMVSELGLVDVRETMLTTVPYARCMYNQQEAHVLLCADTMQWHASSAQRALYTGIDACLATNPRNNLVFFLLALVSECLALSVICSWLRRDKRTTLLLLCD